MVKKIKIYFFFNCLFYSMFLFIAATSFSIAAQPGFSIDDWATMAWTSNSDNPRTGFEHWVKVIDYDGFLTDGSQHTVAVTYPDSTTRTMNCLYRENEYTAVYEFWDNTDPTTDPTTDPATYSGKYVYRITDNKSGEWSEMIDAVEINYA